jgi:hypothetical protein
MEQAKAAVGAASGAVHVPSGRGQLAASCTSSAIATADANLNT